jgi:hypothetical protein
MSPVSTQLPEHGAPPCYLCGAPLRPPQNSDHVPLRGLIAPAITQKHNLDRLLTIPVHKACNTAFSRDEEYFLASLMPFSRGSEAGDAIYRKYLDDFSKDARKAKLMRKVLREFDPAPSGLFVPGKVVKRQDGARISRVAWKIVRGLYFHHHRKVMPEGLNTNVTMTAPGERPPEPFLQIKDLPDDVTHGRYPGIFDYRFRCFEVDQDKLHYWGMLLWDKLIITVAFHDPWTCNCEKCVAALAALPSAA